MTLITKKKDIINSTPQETNIKQILLSHWTPKIKSHQENQKNHSTRKKLRQQRNNIKYRLTYPQRLRSNSKIQEDND